MKAAAIIQRWWLDGEEARAKEIVLERLRDAQRHKVVRRDCHVETGEDGVEIDFVTKADARRFARFWLDFEAECGRHILRENDGQFVLYWISASTIPY